jgi:anti-anti-sigma factor
MKRQARSDITALAWQHASRQTWRVLAHQLQSTSPEGPAMTTIGLAILDHNDCLEVRVLTDLTIRNSAAIRTGILSAWEDRGRPHPLVLDLAGARHIDSSGVGALLEIYHWTEDAGVELVLRGLHNSPRRMMQRTGLGGLFHIAGMGAPAIHHHEWR